MTLYVAGRRLVVQGDAGDEVLVLLKGEVEVVRHSEAGDEMVVATISAPAVIGEMAVIDQVPRSADIVAKSDAEALRIPQKFFASMLESDALRSDHQKILERISVSRALSQTAILASVPPDIIGRVTDRTSLRPFAANDIIVSQGGKDRDFFIVIRGEVEILKDENRVGQLGPGEFFGEMALISNKTRNATVKAISDCDLACLSAEAFWDLLLSDLNLATTVEAIAEDRMGAI